MGETDSQSTPRAASPQVAPAKGAAVVASGPVNPGMPKSPATPMPARPATPPRPMVVQQQTPQQPQPSQPHPTPAPAQSGPMPSVPAQTAALPSAAPLPVAVPGPDYHPPVAGGVNPTGSAGKQPKKRNGLLVFGIIVCILAAIVLVVALVYVNLRQQTEPLNVNAPSTATIQAAFDSSDLTPANLSSYSYIDTEGLDDPELTDVKAGSVNYGEGRQSATCDATAKAKWENDSVSVEQTVQVPFTYNTSTNTWDVGRATAQSAGEKVAPTGPADLEKVQAALPSLLSDYDPEIASLFPDPEVVATADLDKDGGQITFAVDQAGENEEDQHTQTDVTVGLVWEDGKGWAATILGVGEIQGPAQPAEGDDANAAAGAEGGAEGNTAQSGATTDGGDGAQMLLRRFTGELVEVPGIIEYRDNRVLLRSDYTIRVILDGRTYLAQYFELTANTFVVTNGAHVSVVGEISATGALEQAPLMIDLDYES